MKKVIYPLLCSLIIPTLIYLAFSFGNTTFNIKKWHELALILCPMLLLLGIVAGVILGLNINDEIKKQ